MRVCVCARKNRIRNANQNTKENGNIIEMSKCRRYALIIFFESIKLGVCLFKSNKWTFMSGLITTANSQHEKPPSKVVCSWTSLGIFVELISSRKKFNKAAILNYLKGSRFEENRKSDRPLYFRLQNTVKLL